jgi:pyruvate carboxylase
MHKQWVQLLLTLCMCVICYGTISVVAYAAMFDDAIRLTSTAKYLNAGTVEFLVDKEVSVHCRIL